MYKSYDSGLLDLVQMVIYLIVYNIVCIYYYIMTACKEMAVIDGDKSKNTNLVYFASMFFPIQQFTWLQAHWLFALLYLKLTQSLQNENKQNFLKPNTLLALNVLI